MATIRFQLAGLVNAPNGTNNPTGDFEPTPIPRRFDSLSRAIRELSKDVGPADVVLIVQPVSGINTWEDDVSWIVTVPQTERGNMDAPVIMYCLKEVIS